MDGYIGQGPECKHEWVYIEDLIYLKGKEATLDTIEIFVKCKKCTKHAQEIYNYNTRLDDLGNVV